MTSEAPCIDLPARCSRTWSESLVAASRACRSCCPPTPRCRPTRWFAAIVLLMEAEDPAVYLVPSTEWLNAAPPLKDRPNIGKRSEPEYGISVARSSLPGLGRYAWDEGMHYLR